MALNALHYAILGEALKPKLQAAIVERYGNFLEPKELEHLTQIGLKAIRLEAQKANDEALTPEAAIPRIVDAMNRAISNEFFSEGKSA